MHFALKTVIIYYGGDNMDNNIYIEFGKRLSKLRSKKGFSQNDIAKKLGIAQTTYSGYENGVRKIPLEFITTLSDILNISPTFLINGNFSNSLEYQTLIKKYRTLDEKGKHTVDVVLDIEHNRCMEMVTLTAVARGGAVTKSELLKKDADFLFSQLKESDDDF